MRKAIATISTEAGTMTIYYNGKGQEMTGESGDLIEEIEYRADSLEDACDAVNAMYGTGPWDLTWIED